MRHGLAALFAALLCLQAFAAPPVLNRTTFIDDLESPWDMAFTPDGYFLFTEKCNGLSVRTAQGQVRKLFGSKGAVLVADDFFCEGQSGMHGLALAPDFTVSRHVFVYMPSKLGKIASNRVVRLKLNADYTAVSNRSDIVTGINFKASGNSWGSPGSHSGGRIRFSPDGFLYVTTGDNHNGTFPQDLKQLGGKVLRVTVDGKAATGNGTPTGADARIYTYGHRNVQGIAFHPATSQAYISEHGPGHSDEVTVLTAGGNGGWDPRPASSVRCADNYCGYTSNNLDEKPTSMTDLEKYPRAMKPLWVLADSQGLGPLTFLTGSQWKEWNGRLAVGILAGRRIDILELGPNREFKSLVKAPLPSERIRSLVQGPDGNLYVAIDGGTIWKVEPK